MVATVEQRRDCVESLLPFSTETVIQNCWAHFDDEDATLLSEVYYAKEKSENALYLYAQSLVRSGKIESTYDLLKKEGFDKSGRIRFIFAKCAYDIGKSEEADAALRKEGTSTKEFHLHDSIDENTHPFAQKLLAKIFTEHGQLHNAKLHYAMSLVSSPFMISAMILHGRLGGDSVAKLFNGLTDENDQRTSKAMKRQTERVLRARHRFAPHISDTVPLSVHKDQPSYRNATAASSHHTLTSMKRKRTPTAQSQPITRQSTSPPRVTKKSTDSDRAVADYVVHISEVIELLTAFKCDEALMLLNQAPQYCHSISFTMRIRGMILFELEDYKRSTEVLLDLRRLFPSRLEGMDYLSTALWQLQNANELSALAADLINKARDQAITWCVVGNSLSLQKHHEAAVEAFERAIQIEPRFAYAYSLLGHELIDMNNLKKAADAFRQAQLHSPNDYKALYGEGIVCYKSEMYPNARVAFTKAAKVNPRSVTLLCQLAVVEHAMRRNGDAMEHLTRALELEPNSIVCRYHKARILFDCQKYKEAEKELNELKNLSPDEAHVFFLLGRVYRKLNNQHLAMLNFSWATEIDPRGEQNQSAISEQGPYDDDAVDMNDSDRRQQPNESF